MIGRSAKRLAVTLGVILGVGVGLSVGAAPGVGAGAVPGLGTVPGVGAGPGLGTVAGVGAAWVATGPASGRSSAAAGYPSGYVFRELQMNLCNSGVASCFDGGQSIPEAASVIRSQIPDVVTLDEICSSDLAPLEAALADVRPGSTIFGRFTPAWSRSRNQPIQCTGGRGDYGIGIVGSIPGTGAPAPDTLTGRYAEADQDQGADEERAYVCVRVAAAYDACTTHLANGSGSVALRQCKDLMSAVIPAYWQSTGRQPTVVGGDLNLRYGGIPNVQDCVPSGWYRKGDGSVQHVMATNDLAFDSSQSIGVTHTDHPAWRVSVRWP